MLQKTVPHRKATDRLITRSDDDSGQNGTADDEALAVRQAAASRRVSKAPSLTLQRLREI
jgi:hypothetical protein